MILDKNWGVPLDRMEEFFAGEPDVGRCGNLFFFEECRITVTALPGLQLGSLEIPLTRVLMEGPEEDVETIHRRLYFRFLSAGG